MTVAIYTFKYIKSIFRETRMAVCLLNELIITFTYIFLRKMPYRLEFRVRMWGSHKQRLHTVITVGERRDGGLIRMHTGFLQQKTLSVITTHYQFN